jgi:hypothetical protein
MCRDRDYKIRISIQRSQGHRIPRVPKSAYYHCHQTNKANQGKVLNLISPSHCDQWFSYNPIKCFERICLSLDLQRMTLKALSAGLLLSESITFENKPTIDYQQFSNKRYIQLCC